MKKNLYATVLVLIFAPTLVQLLDQLLPMLGIYTTPGTLLGKLFSGGGWARRVLAMLTTLGFPPYANGSAVGPFHAGGTIALVLNALAVALAGRRLFLPANLGGNVLAPTFEKPQVVVAWVALVLLAIALVQKWVALPLVPALGDFIQLVTFEKVKGVAHLGGVLLAFTFWWTEIRNLARAVVQAG
ncbi:MAG: hypothetical protein HPY82_25250 [Gammaproteobacteria bacterium]|nr:hypothetical protein [Gammaproteobacteria bacterium]